MANKMKSTVIAFVILISLMVAPGSAFSAANEAECKGARQLFVSATAAPGGNGTRRAPFNSLAAVEAASEQCDTIFLMASPITVPPLDGGIALKPYQRLTGFFGSLPHNWAPRITNSSGAQNSGDAVTLATNNEVSDLVIVDAYRGGIYGVNVEGATIRDNEIIGGNVSCVPGFLVFFPAPFVLPNGWAAIMVDANAGETALLIENNYIHDGYCNDGIDIRASGDASVKAEVNRNDITRLPEGPAVRSVLALGMQTRDNAQLIVNSHHNSQTYIGSPEADCEGLFTNQTGGSLVWNISHNTFAHGIGGKSCNGAEFFLADGAATSDIHIRHSTFEDNPGDMLEQINTGVGSVSNLTIEDVEVKQTALATPLPLEDFIPPPVMATLINRGYCLAQYNNGVQAPTTLRMINSRFSDCATDGILANFVNLWRNEGSGGLSSIYIENSEISNVNDFALHFVNYGTLDALRIKVQHSSFTNARGNALMAFDQAPGAETIDSKIDLGGGALGSAGHNCFLGGPGLDAETEGYDVKLEHNWWGNPAGPPANSLSATNGSLDVMPVLPRASGTPCGRGSSAKLVGKKVPHSSR